MKTRNSGINRADLINFPIGEEFLRCLLALLLCNYRRIWSRSRSFSGCWCSRSCDRFWVFAWFLRILSVGEGFLWGSGGNLSLLEDWKFFLLIFGIWSHTLSELTKRPFSSFFMNEWFLPFSLHPYFFNFYPF